MSWKLQIDDTNQTFKNKHNDLFKELDKVTTALPHENYTATRERRELHTDKRTSTKTYKGKQSIFKRPEAPIRKCLPVRKRPDYQVNPQKWTKYTLNDVTAEDMSEKATRSAALSFLKDLEKRKEEEGKIQFKSSAMIADEEHESVSSFQNSKRIMPEYVIGQKMKKEKKKRVKQVGIKEKELMLSHLMESKDDDEVEEDNT